MDEETGMCHGKTLARIIYKWHFMEDDNVPESTAKFFDVEVNPEILLKMTSFRALAALRFNRGYNDKAEGAQASHREWLWEAFVIDVMYDDVAGHMESFRITGDDLSATGERKATISAWLTNANSKRLNPAQELIMNVKLRPKREIPEGLQTYVNWYLADPKNRELDFIED